MENKKHFETVVNFKETLDSISPSFCMAKWLQSTTLLFNGETHSCHHPARHKIKVEDIINNPRGIHNTPTKIAARQDLLDGTQTEECDYCWRIENSNPNNMSDRHYKSAAHWARKKLKQVMDSKLGENINPTYFEVAFESTCNFSCMYCSPEVSSQYMAEVEKHGAYKLSGDDSLHDPNYIRQIGRYPIRHDEPNPYIDAFWTWWPDLYKDLEVFRITGGEPLLSKHTWSVFDYAKDNPNSKLEIAINTNLGIPDKLVDQLIENIEQVRPNVKEVKIYTSIEAAGSAAEYIRYGMDYERFINNINRLLEELPGQRVVIMTTINALSAFSFVEFLTTMIGIRKKFKDTGSTLGLSFNYLRWPQFQDIRILPEYIKEEVGIDIRKFVRDNKPFFIGEELDQIERLIKYMKQDIPNRDKLLEDFKCFYNQYDQRKGLSFTKTFPQLARFVK